MDIYEIGSPAKSDAGLTHPDWEAIKTWVEKNVEKVQRDPTFHRASIQWLKKLGDQLGDEYKVYESESFLMLTVEQISFANEVMQFSEDSLARILNDMDGIARDTSHGKHVIILLRDFIEYRNYIRHFIGEYQNFPNGVKIRTGYRHVALPSAQLSTLKSVIAQELTSSCLSHLPLPIWLQYAVSNDMKRTLCGEPEITMFNDEVDAHYDFWRSHDIRGFWSGEFFFMHDERGKMSYSLAETLFTILRQESDNLSEFIMNAHFSDGGELAANEFLGNSLGDFLTVFLGPGEWIKKQQTDDDDQFDDLFSSNEDY